MEKMRIEEQITEEKRPEQAELHVQRKEEDEDGKETR